MRSPDGSNGVGDASSVADGRSLGDHCRQINQDAHALAAAVQDATSGVEGYLTERVQSRPFVTLGVAAGIGYVLGGGLRPRLTSALLGAATRVALAVAARELVDRLSPAPSPSVHAKSS